MRTVFLVAVGFMLAAPSGAAAQTKISGTSQCGKPDPQHIVPAGDQASHSFSISKLKCTWPKPFELAGVSVKDDELTVFEEVTGSTASDRTFVVGTMANGDKIFVRAQGKAVIKDGAVQSGEGTWTYVGGTGKFKGLKGKGAYKSDGTTTQIEGEYQLGPSAKPKT